jgi:hypothetical protein
MKHWETENERVGTNTTQVLIGEIVKPGTLGESYIMTGVLMAAAVLHLLHPSI